MLSYVSSWLTVLASVVERDEEEGQGLVEYALIIVLVSIAAIGTLTILGTTVSGVFAEITSFL